MAESRHFIVYHFRKFCPYLSMQSSTPVTRKIAVILTLVCVGIVALQVLIKGGHQANPQAQVQ